jgi:hypothetical protein
LASRMVAGPSCRMLLSPGFLTRYLLWRPRLMTRGQVRCRRGGLRCLGLAMSALTCASRRRECSGGKSRADSPAHDPQGAPELDPVRIDPGVRGGGADQGADRVMGQQVAPDLLLDQFRAPGPQDLSRAAQACLELGVSGLVLVRSARSAVLALRPARFSGPRSRTGRAAWHRIRLSAGPVTPGRLRPAATGRG